MEKGKIHVVYGPASMGKETTRCWITVETPGGYIVPDVDSWQNKRAAVMKAFELAKKEGYTGIVVHSQTGDVEVEMKPEDNVNFAMPKWE